MEFIEEQLGFNCISMVSSETGIGLKPRFGMYQQTVGHCMRTEAMRWIRDQGNA